MRENSFIYPSIKLWNSAPPEVTIAETESKARIATRNFVKTLPIWSNKPRVKTIQLFLMWQEFCAKEVMKARYEINISFTYLLI